jgi:hypothetical protein
VATRNSLSLVVDRAPSELRVRVACGALAGPLFVVAFTVIGASRPAYDWRRHTVSSLAVGHRGWLQRVNFILAGVLYSYAARGLGRCPRRRVGPRVVPALVAAVGIGLIGSGVFVTDPMGGFPPVTRGEDRSNDVALAETAPTREGKMHNVCAVPIFAGIPLAGLASAVVAARRRDYHWGSYSASSSLVMVASFVLMGRAFGGVPRLAGKGGIFQRISIASGFGWLTALSLRVLTSLPRP